MGQGKYIPFIATMGCMWNYIVQFYQIVPNQQPLNILCLDIILMVNHKKDVTPVCPQWSYIFLTLIHQYILLPLS